MRILYITDSFPYPTVSGDRIRVYNLIRRIALQNEVWLAAVVDSPDEMDGVKHMKEFCTGVITAPVRRYHPFVHIPGLINHAMRGIPLEMKFIISSELIKKIKLVMTDVIFDLVQIEHSHLALYAERIGFNPASNLVLDFHNVVGHQYSQISHLKLNRFAQFRAWLFSISLRRWEPRYAERFDNCITVSEADRLRLLKLNPTLPIEVVPNGVDCNQFQPLTPFTGPPSLLFIGTMNYPPCTDAAIFFCKEILPEIRKQIPDIRVWIVGKDPPPEIINLQTDGVTVTGRVKDVVPYYQQSTACVVPLRAGGGTRLKILEAMALQRPVVSTSIGCEGLEVADNHHLLIANDPEEFAKKTVSLLTDDFLYGRIVREARKLVETLYDWDIIARRLQRLYLDTCISSS
jgi:polysaccharide biosynthesis protein PslH